MRNLARCRSQTQAPPPSPVPTARGTRNAANDLFMNFLERQHTTTSYEIPELTLPDAHMPAAMRNPALPSMIDYHKLKEGTMNTILQKSAKAFGSFVIFGHGISDQNLKSMAIEANNVFEDSNVKGRCVSDRIRIPCVLDNQNRV